MYLNSGDWIENLTALEYVNGQWKIYRFDETELLQMNTSTAEEEELDNGKLFDSMVEEFNLLRN